MTDQPLPPITPQPSTRFFRRLPSFKQFRAASAELTRKAISNTLSFVLDDHVEKFVGGAIAVIPTVTALKTLGPWAAAPVAIGSIMAGTACAFERFHTSVTKALKVGAVTGASALAVSAVGHGIYANPLTKSGAVDAAVAEKLNDVCWAQGDAVNGSYKGQPYTLKIDGIRETTLGDNTFHRAKVSVAYPYKTFALGSTIRAEEHTETNARPYRWEKSIDYGIHNGAVVKLNCH